MEQCFLCGKPALKMVEIKVGSSSTIALVGCLGPLVIAAIGGTLFYFFGQR